MRDKSLYNDFSFNHGMAYTVFIERLLNSFLDQSKSICYSNKGTKLNNQARGASKLAEKEFQDFDP